jgi:hypothetical protein
MEKPAEPKGIDVTSANGKTELEAQVQSRLSGQIHDFRLVVAAEGLILRGRASTYHAKQLAQHEVMAASVLPILANEIEVQ